MLNEKLQESRSLRLLAAALLAAALSAGVLAGCSNSDDANQGGARPEATQSASEKAVTVSAVNTLTDETLASGAVELPEGSTVLDALQALPVDVVVEDSQYGAYVSAVGDVVGEGMQGWTYTVNGEMLPVSAGEAVVQPGDVVEWTFIDMSE